MFLYLILARAVIVTHVRSRSIIESVEVEELIKITVEVTRTPEKDTCILEVT